MSTPATARPQDIGTHYSNFARDLGNQRGSWVAIAESGLLGLTMPESLGGCGRDLAELIAAMEGLAYGGADAGVLFALGAQIWSIQYPILRFGSSQQQARLLPPLMSGRMRAAHAVTERESGADVFAIQTRASSCKGGFVINGEKSHITAAPVADVALVMATTKPADRLWGLSAFIVDLKAPGALRGPNVPKMGLRSAEFGALWFRDCFVPHECLLGKEGAGATIFNFAMEYERAFILAPALGVMRRQLERCVSGANQRHRGGHTLGSFQSVSNRIADMATRLELARLVMYKAAELREGDGSCRQFASVVKLVVSELLFASSVDAMRLGGAAGYVADEPAETDLRDSIGSLFYSGTADILRTLIARDAGLSGV